MKRFLKGMLCASMVWMMTGCQEQQTVTSAPTAPASIETKADPEPVKPVEQLQTTQSEEPKPAQVEPQPKEAAPVPALESKPAEKPAPTKHAQSEKPAPTAKPVSKPQPAPPQPTAVPKPVTTKTSEPAPQPVKQQIVTLSIIGDEQLGTILSATEVGFEEGDTVLDVLKKATKEKKIPMEYSGSGVVAYVEGIDNLYEFDRGPKSGWVYRVNGVMGGRSAGDVSLKSNDRIEWLYTLDLGKDLE